MSRKFMFQAIVIAVLSLLLIPLSFLLNPSSYASFYPSLSVSTFISGLDRPTTAGKGDQDSNGNGNSNGNNNIMSAPDGNVKQANRNNTNTLRTYTNSAFNLTVQYPPTWGVMELKANPYSYPTEVPRSSPVAVILSPLEKESDKFQEKVLIGVQNLLPSRMTLQEYTKSSLSSYRNQSDTFKILESGPTTLAGQPAHKIVFTDDSVNGSKLKKIQVWTVLNNSKAYVITFGSEESKYADYLPQVQNILSSFRITTDIDNNNTREQGNLTFDDPMFGIKLQYPSSWTKIQPGLPIDNRAFVFIVSFNSPRPSISIPENNSSSNSNSSSSFSPATISIGINDVSRFISGMTNDSSSSNKTSTNVGNRNVTLVEYTSKQIEHIRQLGAQLRSTSQTTIAGLPAHKIYYLVDKDLLIIQAWTLNEGKAYHIVLSANDPETFVANLPVFYEVGQSMQFNFNSIKTNPRSSD